MIVVLLSMIVFALALFGMSVGVIFSNRRIRGSCGGLANLPGEHGSLMCGTCRSDPSPDCTVPIHGTCLHRRSGIRIIRK
jgi:hypothetical protein